jgi:hypothetical protein
MLAPTVFNFLIGWLAAAIGATACWLPQRHDGADKCRTVKMWLRFCNDGVNHPSASL